MAAGLPVLATPLPALQGVEGVATAPDAAGLAMLLDEALAKDSPQRKLERSQLAASHSWDVRMREIAAAVHAIRAPAGGARALLVTSHTPALRSGRDVRTYGVARALAMDGELTLLYVRFGPSEPDKAFKAIPGVDLREVVPSRGILRLLAYARALRTGVPEGLARGVSPELSRAAASLAGAPGCGRVIADGPTAAAALAGLARRRPVIYNAHNLESGFRHELSDGGSRAQRRLRSFEAGLLRRSSESWMVSEADMRGALELCPSASLRLAPNVVDVTAIEPVVGVAPEHRAIFVANFAYEPNRNGLRFLLEEVLPRVWRQLPDARLTLVGAGLEHPPSDDSRVESLGFVDRLADVYASARCAVVPLLQGGGSPLKLIEALAYGLPVLATPRAVAGLRAQDGRDCLVAEGGEAFADALVHVLRDGSAEVARNGRRLAEESYSIEALAMLLHS
jgi:glycosyltransferase involved in cell wall biosynthesis